MGYAVNGYYGSAMRLVIMMELMVLDTDIINVPDSDFVFNGDFTIEYWQNVK